jgi:hypothetical protein
LKAKMATVAEAVDRAGAPVPTDGDGAIASFEWSLSAADVRHRSNNARKREIRKRLAASRAACTAGANKAMRMPMIAITTSNSTSVKPADLKLWIWDLLI